MKRLYWDVAEEKVKDGCIGIITDKGAVLPAGTTLSVMSVREKDKLYQEFAERYDVQFLFDDEQHQADFYAVPQVDIFAKDSRGGLFGTIGQTTAASYDAPVCYIDQNKRCYRIADSFASFVKLLEAGCGFQETMVLADNVILYPSREAAEQEMEFIHIDLPEDGFPCAGSEKGK